MVTLPVQRDSDSDSLTSYENYELLFMNVVFMIVEWTKWTDDK